MPPPRHKGHEAADAIIHTAQDKNTDYLIMGWKGTIQQKESLIGHNIARVLKESNSHAVAMQKNEIKPGERILVPVANPKTAPLALAIAALITEESPDSEITVLHLTTDELTSEEQDTFRDELFTFARESSRGLDALISETSHFQLEFDVHSNPIIEIARRSKNYDRMILGTSHGGFLRRKVFGGNRCVSPKIATARWFLCGLNTPG